MRTIIKGMGHYTPKNIVTNKDLEKLIDTSDEWIRDRTGIEQRHFITIGKDTTASMGYEAAKIAIANAGIEPDDIDFIIFATLSADMIFPGPGVFVQEMLGIKEVGALDVRTQCTGFIYALSIADQYIKTGMYKTILVIGSEAQSPALDMTDRGRTMSVLFGDGAGAAVVQATDDKSRGVLSTHLHSQGKYAEALMMREPGTGHAQRIYSGIETDYDNIFPYMEGTKVFRHAITRFQEVINEGLQANNLKPEDIDMLIPHQANLRIIQMVQKKLKLNDENVYSNIQRYGNTTAASIPIATSELLSQNRIKKNDLVVLAAFGSGFTWASAIIRW